MSFDPTHYLKEFEELKPPITFPFDVGMEVYERDKQIKAFLLSALEEAYREGGIAAIEMFMGAHDEKTKFCEEIYKEEWKKIAP